MTMLQDGDHQVVIEVTRNVLARVVDRPGGLPGDALSALESLLQRLVDGEVHHADDDARKATAEGLLPVLRSAFRALRDADKGRGNIATQLVAFGAGDEDQALRIAEEAGLP